MNIAVDIDEILADCMTAIVTYYNQTHGAALTLNDFRSMRFSETWGGTDEEAIQIMYDFYQSPLFKELKPIDGAKDALQILKRDHELYVVTARTNDVTDLTLSWIEQHFPNTFTDIFLGNHYTQNGGRSIPKSEICDAIGARALIEDTIDHALDCANDTRRVYLMRYPWNAAYTDLPDNIHGVQSWKEIVHHIQETA